MFIALFLTYHQDLLAPYVPVSQNYATQQIKIGETLIPVEVADSAAKRSRGLGGRDNLAENSGMLFVFPQRGQPRFWMKGMKFPLDLIFIQDGKVVDLLKDVPAPAPGQKDTDLSVYEPTQAIDMVLEVNAGFIARHNISVGDTIYTVR